MITNDASFFSFDDDGPTLTVTAEVSETEAAALAVELDETTGDADRYSSADTPDTYVNDDNGYLARRPRMSKADCSVCSRPSAATTALTLQARRSAA